MFKALFDATGVKRLTASALSAVVEVLRAIPGTGEIVTVIESVAGFFGVTGIVHAGTAGTLSKKKLATASAAISVLIVLSYVVPSLAIIRPYLEKAAAMIGSMAVGAQMVRETKSTESGSIIPPKNKKLNITDV